MLIVTRAIVGSPRGVQTRFEISTEGRVATLLLSFDLPLLQFGETEILNSSSTRVLPFDLIPALC